MRDLTERAQRVVRLAADAAETDGRPCGTNYLLWALLQEAEGPHRRLMAMMERGELDGVRELRRWLRTQNEVIHPAAPVDQLALPGTSSPED